MESLPLRTTDYDAAIMCFWVTDGASAGNQAETIASVLRSRLAWGIVAGPGNRPGHVDRLITSS